MKNRRLILRFVSFILKIIHIIYIFYYNYIYNKINPKGDTGTGFRLTDRETMKLQNRLDLSIRSRKSKPSELRNKH